MGLSSEHRVHTRHYPLAFARVLNLNCPFLIFRELDPGNPCRRTVESLRDWSSAALCDFSNCGRPKNRCMPLGDDSGRHPDHEFTQTQLEARVLSDTLNDH